MPFINMYHLSDLMLYVHSVCASCVVIRAALCGFVLCYKLCFPWEGGAECVGGGEWLILPSQMVIRAFTAFPSQRDACVRSCSSILHAALKIQIRAGPGMAQRLEMMWQITVPVTALPTASDNDVLILPLQRITDDPLPCTTGSSPHKSHAYIMKYL